MAYSKAKVVQYCYYEIVSSYFKKYTVSNKSIEKSLFMHFAEAKADFQYACEDSAIYSIENILPDIIGKLDLNDYDAVIAMNTSDNSLHIDAKNEAGNTIVFDVTCDFEKSNTAYFYKNVFVDGKKIR